MHWLGKIKNHLQSEWLLFSILALAFLLRVVGVGYGLPLLVVNDEAPFTLAALLMIKLHTILPALHPEFQSILYYPPYLSYILLMPFAIILGVLYVLWPGDPALFQSHLLLDLSPFFITARLFNIFLATLSVYLVYTIANTLFRSRVAGYAAAFFLSTSILHIGLSMVGRQWLPVSALFLLVLFLLQRGEWSLKKRYLAAFFVAGIGMGISAICILACALIGIFYLCYDMPPIRNLFRDFVPLMIGGLLFIVLAFLSWLSYHGGNNFTGTVTLQNPKSLGGLFLSPWSAVSLIAFSETVLVGFFLAGIIFCASRARRPGAVIMAFFIVYVVVFYIFFRFDARFVLPMVPFIAIIGGYAISQLWSRSTAAFICILLCVPLVAGARVSYLALKGDTHEYAREWVLKNLKPTDKVLVFSSAMHVPTQAAAVVELRSVDPSALRKIDSADESTDRHDVPYVLNNLTSVTNSTFISNLPSYAKSHGYDYLVFEPQQVKDLPNSAKAFAALIEGARVVQRFDAFDRYFNNGTEEMISISESAFNQPLAALFADKILGSDIVIYQLRK